MEQEEFEEHVREALDGLPTTSRAASRTSRSSSRTRARRPGYPRQLLRVPAQPWTPSGALPAKVVVYRRPLEEAFADPVELQRQIRITVLHELAHYFGIDEQRIAELGYR